MKIYSQHVLLSLNPAVGTPYAEIKDHRKGFAFTFARTCQKALIV
jgi:hypothetical protein